MMKLECISSYPTAFVQQLLLSLVKLLEYLGCVIDRIAQRALVIVISCIAFVATYGVMMVF